MQYIIIIACIVIAAYFLLVYLGSRKVEAIGIVKAGKGKIESTIICNQNNKKPLLAMALCYAAKIKWLILTEPNWTERTFINIFENTLNSWPEIPYVEMLSSTWDFHSIYKIKVYSIGGWHVSNTIPKKRYYSGDLVTNYFVLLKAILNELNNNEKALLGNLFNEFKDGILGISLKDRSINALRIVNKKANELLNKI